MATHVVVVVVVVVAVVGGGGEAAAAVSLKAHHLLWLFASYAVIQDEKCQ